MKLKDHYQKLKEQAKIDKNEALDKFIETAPDIDIPDPVIAVIEENFLTRERAKTDKEIHSKIKAEVYDGVDATISSMFSLISVEDAQKVGAETNTHNKIAMIKKAVEGSLEKAKTANPDSNKKVEELEKSLRTLAETKTAADAENEKKLNDLKAAHATEIKKKEIDNILMGKISQIELAKEFSENPEVKKGVINTILSGITKETLNFDEKGQLIVQEIENGVAKPKFNGNDLVTVDKLLETASAAYIKRNNGKGGKEKGEEQKHKTEIPANQMTLADRRQAHYAS